MAKGFDELLRHLLDEIALSFAAGLLVSDFKLAVLRFYNDAGAQHQPGPDLVDRNLSSAVDRKLLEKAWSWITHHPDVWTGRSPESELGRPEVLMGSGMTVPSLSLFDAESSDEKSDGSSLIRLWTSHERVWQTVAGHGVDFKRVAGEEFRLLCLIANAGPKGIVQPDLVKLAKQDKKSVPGRTDSLFSNGYIRKTRIMVEKHNTSLLVHRKFVPPADLEAMARPVFVNGALSFDNLLNLLKEKLKDGAQIKTDELLDMVGCNPKSWEKKSIRRALERLDIIGVVMRFRQDEIKPNKNGVMRAFSFKFIKLLREPTEEDRRRYTSLTFKDREAFRRRLEAQDAEATREHAEDMEADDFAVAPANEEEETGPIAEDIPSHPAAFDTDMPWTNMIYNVVAAGEERGLSSRAVRRLTYGGHYDRPIDQMLARLTDVWNDSQPPSLSHFSVIRDTDIKGRATNYVYRTRDAFQEAVDAGRTLWENATNGKPYQKPVPELDEFGFEKLDRKLFLKDGTASLEECLQNAPRLIDRNRQTEPKVVRRHDGTVGVLWSAKKRRAKTGKSEQEVLDSEAERGSWKPICGPPTTGTDNSMHEIELPVPVAHREAARKLRTKAEETAYDEAKDNEDFASGSLATAKLLEPLFKTGSGRRRMLIVNDVDPEARTEEEFKVGKRKPVVVLESRVRELVEKLRGNSGAAARNPSKVTADDSDADEDAFVPSPRRKSRPRRSTRKTHTVGAVGSQLERAENFADEAEKDVDPFQTESGQPHTPVAKTRNRSEGSAKKTLLTSATSPAKPKRPEIAKQSSDAATRSAMELVPEPAAAPVPKPRPEPAVPAEATSQDLSDPVLVSVPDPTTDAPQASEELSEVAVVAKVPQSLDMGASPGQKEWALRNSSYIRPAASSGYNRRKHGTLVGHGTASYKRTLLIYEVLDKCGGIFPGNSEMVPAFQKLQREDPKTTIISDRDTITRAVKILVDSGKLKRVSFRFVKNGEEHVRWILLREEVSFNDPKVKTMMRFIEEVWPRNFLPPPFGPPLVDGGPVKLEQRKNIDRFQYRPGKSVVRPSGTEFVVDVEAKRRELESRRLAAEAAKKAEERAQLKAQAERNKQRQANTAARIRARGGIVDYITTPFALRQTDEDDPDRVLPSIEPGPAPGERVVSTRPRYRRLRPPYPAGRDRTVNDRTALRTEQFSFTEPEGLHTYGTRRYGPPDLLQPVERFHAASGTFSSDLSFDKPQTFAWLPAGLISGFENLGDADPEHVKQLLNMSGNNNYYRPHKRPRVPPRLLPKKSQTFTADMKEKLEAAELADLQESYPGLIHNRTGDGFENLTMGHPQEIYNAYQRGNAPMEHVIFHGADPRDFRGINFNEQVPNDFIKKRPNAYPLPEPVPLGLQMSRFAESIAKAPQVAKPPKAKTITKSATKPATKPKARPPTQSGKCIITPDASKRLFYACIAIKCLMGDFDMNMTWSEIPKIFEDYPDFDLPTFKARWIRMYNQYRKLAEQIQNDLQEKLPKAIRDREVPPVTFNGGKASYKDAAGWHKLISWAIKEIPAYPENLSMTDMLVNLPAHLEIKAHPVNYQDLRDKMEHVNTTNTKRNEIAHALPFTIPLRLREPLAQPTDPEMELARSWVRANVATPPESYDARAATAKLKLLNQPKLLLAGKALHDERILAPANGKRGDAVGRFYALSDNYNNAIFAKRPIDLAQFSDAVKFKLALDTAFATSDPPHMRLEPITSDGGYMALSEMAGRFRIDEIPLLPPVNSQIGDPMPRLSIWGFSEGNYKLRNMDRKMFHWNIELRPGTMPGREYIPGLPLQEKIDKTPPPKHPKGDPPGKERIPLWFDINGQLIPKWWAAVVRCVFQHTMTRAGASISVLTGAFKGLVWQWEVQMVLEWGKEVGALKELMPGSWMAAEWWWTAVPEGPELVRRLKGAAAARAKKEAQAKAEEAAAKNGGNVGGADAMNDGGMAVEPEKPFTIYGKEVLTKMPAKRRRATGGQAVPVVEEEVDVEVPQGANANGNGRAATKKMPRISSSATIRRRV